MEGIISLIGCLLEYCMHSACNGLVIHQVGFHDNNINVDNQIDERQVMVSMYVQTSLK